MNEYLSSNAYIAYPFVDNAEGILSGAFPSDAILDAAFAVDGCVALYLKGVGATGTGTTRRRALVIADADGREVMRFDLVNFSGDWGVDQSGMRVIPQQVVLGDGLASQASGVLLSTPRLYTFVDSLSEDVDFGTTLPFSARTNTPTGPHVLSLHYLNTKPMPEISVGSVDDVRIGAGHNISLDVEHYAENGELDQDTTTITISAIPGAGAGKIPCDEDAEKKTNRYGWNGDVNIETDGCYSVLPVIRENSASFIINGRCTPCCTCEDFVAVLDMIKAVGARIETLRSSVLLPTHNAYETRVDEFNDYVRKHTGIDVGFSMMMYGNWTAPKLEAKLVADVPVAKILNPPGSVQRSSGDLANTPKLAVTISVENKTESNAQLTSANIVAPGFNVSDTVTWTLNKLNSATGAYTGESGRGSFPTIPPRSKLLVIFRASRKQTDGLPPPTPSCTAYCGVSYFKAGVSVSKSFSRELEIK